MKNEVLIHVRAVNDTKAVFDVIRAQAHDLGDTIAIDVNKTVTQRLEKEAQAAASGGGAYSRAGDEIGKTMGDHISERITERIKVSVNENVRDSVREHVDVDTHNRETVKVNVDVDKKSLEATLAGVGKDVAENTANGFEEGMKTGATGVFSGDIFSTIIKAGLITLAGGVLAPAIGAAITSGILLALGGGAIGIGILGALKDPRIKVGINGLKGELKGLFADFSSNFTGPLEEVLFPSNGGGGGLTGLIKQLTPGIEQLGKALGPIAGQLGQGLIGFLQNALPPILRAMEAGGPIVQVLADRLPGLGDKIGTFFDLISDGAPEAAQFFDDMIRAVGFAIEIIGGLILAFTKMYRYARTATLLVAGAFAEMAYWIISAADAALGWIPGWGPKLDAAKKKVSNFEKAVNKSLDGIKDKDITVYVHAAFDQVLSTTFGAFRSLYGKKASGGVIGQAASGGSRSGLTWVGEHGPELIDAAPGSRVSSNPDSMRMASAGGGRGGTIVVPVYLDGREIARAMLDPTRDIVRNQYGGSAQAAFGVA